MDRVVGGTTVGWKTALKQCRRGERVEHRQQCYEPDSGDFPTPGMRRRQVLSLLVDSILAVRFCMQSSYNIRRRLVVKFRKTFNKQLVWTDLLDLKFRASERYSHGFAATFHKTVVWAA